MRVERLQLLHCAECYLLSLLLLPIGFFYDFGIFLSLGHAALAQETRPPANPVGSANTSTQPQPLSVLDQLVKRARECFDKGDYAPALEAALAADSLIDSGSQSNSVLRVRSLSFISEICLKKQSFVEAEGYARRALKIFDSLPKRSPDDYFDHLRAFRCLVTAFRSQDRYAEAIYLADTIATNTTQNLAPFDLEPVLILSEGASAAVALNDNPTAIRFTRLQAELENIAAVRIRNVDSQTAAKRKEAAVRCEYLLGIYLFQNGDYDESIKVLTAAAPEAEQLGKVTLHDEILVYIGCGEIWSGDVEGGIVTLNSIVERMDDASSAKELARLNLATGYTKLEQHEKAKELFAKMLQSAIRIGNFAGAIRAVSDHGRSLLEAGDLIEARECFENELRALDSQTGEFAVDRLLMLEGLTRAYCSLDDLQKAGPTLAEAWHALPNAVAHDSLVDSNLAVTGLLSIECNFYGQSRNWKKELDSALKSHSLALEFAKDNPVKMTESYLYLGRAYYHNADFSTALRCLESAAKELGKQRSTSFGQKIQILDWLAVVHSASGDMEKAVECRTQLVDLALKKFGRRSPKYFRNLALLADDLIRIKSFELASELCVESQLLFIEHAWRGLAFLPIGMDTGSAGYSFVPDIVAMSATQTANESVHRNAAYVSLINKGLHGEVATAQGLLAASGAAKKAREAIKDFWSAAGAKQTNALEAFDLREKIVADVLALCKGSTPTLLEISKAIPPNARLVDFCQYVSHDPRTLSNRVWQLAYLISPLAKNSTNVMVQVADLGEALPIYVAIEQLAKLMAAGQIAPKRLQPVLQRLSDLVYAPLAKHLTNVSHLIVCPDGQLSRVPFEMLLHNGKYLIESKTISYVTSGREIVRLASGQASPKSKAQRSKSLVMGDPDFDLDLGSARASRAVADASSATTEAAHNDRRNSTNDVAATAITDRRYSEKFLSRSARGLKFTRLPSAAAEARSVASLLGKETNLRLGKDAREAELKAVVSPRVLHLATHGFFLSDQEFKYTNSVRDGLLSANFASFGGNQFTARRSLASPENDWENPLVRCGIALAGANRALQITNALAEDGLLTGLEASLLNLQGTELVVLSACDSGAGEIKIGEGVMSLRRAFRIAGAETVLASHWKVSDKATSQLMTEFMRRWRSGEPRVQAWREAQLALLHSKDFSNPYFWAAFTLTGQWR